jgi:phosphinothricin acetyltransferase
VSTPDVEIRAAEPADLGPIVEIYNEGVEDGVATCDLSATTADERREWFAAHASPYGIWVAKVDGVVGWISLSPYDAKPCFARTGMLSTYVRRAWRGRQVGSALRVHVVEEAERRGFHTLISRVWANNPQSIALVRKFGWRQVGHIEEAVFRDGEYVDCLLFQHVFGRG